MTGHAFRPDWCLAPAAVLAEWLAEHGMSVPVLATAAAGRARRDEAAAMIQDVLDRKPLTEAHAMILQAGTGVTARFWSAFEHNYRAGLAAGLTDTTPEDGDA